MKRIGLTTLGALAAIYALSGFYIVRPEERAVVRRFGAARADLASPGLHYHWPRPIERVDRIKATEVRQARIGFSAADRVTGVTADPTRRHYLLGDRNIVSVQAVIQYVVPDPAGFLFGSADPQALLEAAAASVLSEAMAEFDVDTVLTIGKTRIQNQCRDALQQLADDYGLGVQVQMVSLQSVAPPMEVADKFRDVVAAREERNQKIQEAGKYRNTALPKARGEAFRAVREAEAYRQTQIDRARGRADRFGKLLAASRGRQEVTRSRLYLETMGEVLPKMNLVLGDTDAGGITLGLSPGSSPQPPGR